MKFVDWYNFNFVDNKVMNLGAIRIEVMRNKSLKNIDAMLRTSMNIEDAVKMFGDYSIISIVMKTGNSYELCAFVYKEEN